MHNRAQRVTFNRNFVSMILITRIVIIEGKTERVDRWGKRGLVRKGAERELERGKRRIFTFRLQ